MDEKITLERVEQEVDSMCKATDFAASVIPHNKTLLLIGGDEHQAFYDGIRAKARNAGVTVSWQASDAMLRMEQPVDWIVYDTDYVKTHNPRTLQFREEQDLDNMFRPGMSSCAAACFSLMKRLDLLKGKDVLIIGRGHAVKGLAEACMQNDATVTVAHSKTHNIGKYHVNTIVNCAPQLEDDLWCPQLMIDVHGSCKFNFSKGRYYDPVYFNKIGRLTTSLLITRANVR